MSHDVRWGGFAGAGAVVLVVASRLIEGSAPGIDASPETITAYVVDHRDQILVASVLFAAAMPLVVWFGATLAAIFRRAGSTGVLPALVLAGFAVLATLGVVVTSILAGMTYAVTAHPTLQPMTAAPFTALTIAGTIAGVVSALPLAASAMAILQTAAFPRWLAWLALAAATARVLGAFAVGGTGALLPGGLLVSYVPAVLALVWVVSTTALLIREHLPVITAATQPLRHA
ncbi:hypothetical protein GCM10009682_28360 [Luedemannella flava]|uniref:DUF4386 family protein n=1 Tax=Luedemannella flava TaxID=349316 RepID=A0ABP4Y633_9ACTN